MPFTNPLRDPDGNPVPPIVVLVATKKQAEAIAEALGVSSPDTQARVAGILAKLAEPKAATRAP
jgi:hypothetical protein